MNLTRALPVKLLMLVCMSFALAACGSEKEESEGERGEAFGTVCEMTQLSGDTGLPQDFPITGDVVFVKSEEAGPSLIVEGYAEGELEDVYDEWHSAFESSDYEITFDEREDHDAEISFEGGGQSGQVKLADECGDGRIYVRVTARPTE